MQQKGVAQGMHHRPVGQTLKKEPGFRHGIDQDDDQDRGIDAEDARHDKADRDAGLVFAPHLVQGEPENEAAHHQEERDRAHSGRAQILPNVDRCRAGQRSAIDRPEPEHVKRADDQSGDAPGGFDGRQELRQA